MVKRGEQLINMFGVFPHDDMIGRAYGSKVRCLCLPAVALEQQEGLYLSAASVAGAMDGFTAAPDANLVCARHVLHHDEAGLVARCMCL